MGNIMSYFLCFIVEAVILLQYVSHLFVPKHSTKSRLFLLTILYTLLFAVSFLNIKWLNMGLYLLCNFIFFTTQYNINYLFAIFHSSLLAAVMGMCELVVYSIIEHFTPNFFLNAELFYNTIIFIICSKLLFFVVVFLITKLFKNSQVQSNPHDNLALLLIFIPLTAIFTMLTLLAISDQYNLTASLNICISLSALSLLIANLLVFGINQYMQQKNRSYTEMQLLLQKETNSIEYYKMLLEQSDNQSILIHDIKKHLQSIHSLNEQNEPEKINNYIEQLLVSSSLKESARICDHELLNTILARYNRQCNALNITFLTDIRSGTMEFINDNDLTSLFCNLLENAIEAASNIPNAYIELTTNKREHTPFVLITMINSCRTNPFKSDNKTLTTSKSNKLQHGYGIKSIHKIVKTYQGQLKMYYTEDSMTFHTIITLKTE